MRKVFSQFICFMWPAQAYPIFGFFVTCCPLSFLWWFPQRRQNIFCQHWKNHPSKERGQQKQAGVWLLQSNFKKWNKGTVCIFSNHYNTLIIGRSHRLESLWTKKILRFSTFLWSNTIKKVGSFAKKMSQTFSYIVF